MDFDGAKENIQPLAAGRNVSILQASLRVESPQELLGQRRQLEQDIHDYEGDDPLESWYTYISWIEQSCPSGGKESGLEEVLMKCLQQYGGDKRYAQDRRMIKLYIKFLGSLKDPTEHYQHLALDGIGTMVADFYISWAYVYDLQGNTRKADEIFRQGIACHAEPFEELQEAHQHFGFSVAQRHMYKEDESATREANRQLNERRLALTSLRGLRRKANVGSIRTGAAVRSFKPGTVETQESSARCNNAQVCVFSDENENPNAQSSIALTAEAPVSSRDDGRSVVSAILEAARDLENEKEPGPWNKAHGKKQAGKLFKKVATNNDLGFSIHVDDEVGIVNSVEQFGRLNSPIPEEMGSSKVNKPFIYPMNFQSKNLPLSDWNTPVTIEEKPDAHTLPQYNKCLLYPRPNMEFQPEELRSYYWFKRRCISNDFTQKRDVYWTNRDANANVRQYPNFAKQSDTQVYTAIDNYFEPPQKNLLVGFQRIYDSEEKQEFSLEELRMLRGHWKNNETVVGVTDMEETVCIPSECMQRRKSFFPATRKSIAPKGITSSKTFNSPDLKEDNIQVKVNKDVSMLYVQDSGEKLQDHIDPNCFVEKNNQTTVEETSTKANSELQISPKPAALPANTIHIYQDDDTASTSSFKFKTPSIPKPSTKLAFEIYTQNSPQREAPPTGAGIFDPDETCSTQTFNLLLKTQSVSTPKVKVQPTPRLFGTLLTDVPIVRQELNAEQQPSFSPSHINSPDQEVDSPAATYSPHSSPLLHKQLSTILETSEHASTQVTASTKSTISSPEFETATCGSDSMTPAPQKQKHITMQAQICGTQPVAVLMESLKLDEQEMCDTSKNKAALHTATPAAIRLQAGGYLENLKHFDKLNENDKLAGDFTRIEEREDTAAALPMRSIRFQDDKTETISKLLLAPRQEVKFQDDKTETISKIIFATPPSMFEEDKTGTIPRIPFKPPILSDGFQVNMDDSFEFFGKSPPKNAVPNAKCFEKDKSYIYVSDFGNDRSPLVSAPKRLCDIKTPELHFQKSFKHSSDKVDKYNTKPLNMPLFEDEVSAPKSAKTKKSFDDSLLPFEDYSMVQLMQPSSELVHKKPATKNILRDSFIPDFSLNEETNRNVVKPLNNVQEAHTSFSFVKDSQPNNNSRKDDKFKQCIQGGNVVATNNKQCDSFLPDFSVVMDSQPQMETDDRWTQKKSTSLIKTETKTMQQRMLLESFMNDFSTIKEVPKDNSRIPPLSPTSHQQGPSNTSSLKFLDASMSAQNQSTKKPNVLQKSSTSTLKVINDTAASDNNKQVNISKLQPLDSSMKSKRAPPPISNRPTSDQFFELNAETEMFATNISMIKNSTWLPNHNPNQEQQLKENSLHIKAEAQSPHWPQPASLETSYTVFKSPPLAATTTRKSSLAPPPKLSFLGNHTEPKKISERTNLSFQIPNPVSSSANVEDDDYGNMSIYYKHTPKMEVKIWEDSSNLITPKNNKYLHNEVDLDSTKLLIDNKCLDPSLNPFAADLISAFLDSTLDFTNYIEALSTCMLVGNVKSLHPSDVINVNDMQFKVVRKIGQGAYGAVFCGINPKTGKKYALKQERPPSLWEYYICLEVNSRIKTEEMVPAFMNVDYALIGNNSSILISSCYSQFGSIINVCNKVKKYTSKNVDEFVVMILACELLEIMDHLHAIEIIHADIKPDNFILINKLSYPCKERSLQLIDFGVSIDMRLFSKGQTFSYEHKEISNKCVEMRENRPWTYQLDLFGLAGVLHALLFGKYMDIEKRSPVAGYWMHKTHVPRYFNKALWDNIFKTLLNISDCESMPNLQQLRAQLKQEIVENEQYVLKKVAEFNSALSS